ncbi:L,D-transpeptidase family protein [candidate division TA06 bacterium]|uniref:L,D-transpeptidase family protein n=1 Tax=candidate division TA06 bacterium TaxID=2250710 RepID=A0A933I7I0_UNCT6|nr:L,D-transpeptidase family protein [candidate division TA06 bacterium]
MRQAYTQKEQGIKELFAGHKLSYPPKQIFLRVFKQEMLLELWVAETPGQAMALLKEYPVCASSGDPGPKRKRGDGQVPEGFYQINHFNPHSNFHLSLGLDYPNRSDRLFGDRNDPGSAIYIHGDCVTIGCIPITDEGIKELYLIALEAKANGQQAIPVHLFPCRMNGTSYQALLAETRESLKLPEFWANLKQGYDIFELNKIVPKVQVDRMGKYLFNQQ